MSTIVRAYSWYTITGDWADIESFEAAVTRLSDDYGVQLEGMFEDETIDEECDCECGNGLEDCDGCPCHSSEDDDVTET